MPPAVMFQAFSEHLAEGVHDLDGDQLDVYLSNATPSVSADVVAADLAGISAGSGYTGPTDIQNATSRSGATTSVTGVDVTITASGGPVGPFRYVVLMNDTPTNPADPLIQYWDYGSSITLQDGEEFVVDFGASVLTVAPAA